MTAGTFPTVARVDALPFEQVRLTLEDGRAVTVDLEAAPRALLCPLPSGAVLLEDWQNATTPAYHVPAHLGASVRAAFRLHRVGA
ncbi:hypothetical protein [Deinococcus altitudinis]|uniref:hypothetical protein n=1 Tax=Deinococcus altitudinis TaxID=468914 RepID=UPI003892B4CE